MFYLTLLHISVFIIQMHLVRRERFFFCHKQWGRGGISDYVPFLGPRTSWLDQTGTCTTRPCILHKTFRLLWKKNCWTKSPYGTPWLDNNCICKTRPLGQQNETINGSLRYLFTEKIEEQDIVYRWPDGWTMAESVSHKIYGLWPVELKATYKALN